jgi:hypothetical protein
VPTASIVLTSCQPSLINVSIFSGSNSSLYSSNISLLSINTSERPVPEVILQLPSCFERPGASNSRAIQSEYW